MAVVKDAQKEAEQQKILQEMRDPEKEFETMWRHDSWLGTYPLHAGTFYDYFKNSDFYDKGCNNSYLEQQQAHMSQLKNMTGVEYGYDNDTLKGYNAPMYLVIHKFNRVGPNDETDKQLTNVYYAPGHAMHPNRGSIYPMPTMNLIFDNKLRNATYHLNTALNAVKNCQSHQLTNGFMWDFEKDRKKQQKEKDKEKDKEKEKQNINEMENIQDEKNSENKNENFKESSDVDMISKESKSKNNNNNNEKEKAKKPKLIQFNQYSSIVDNLIIDLARTPYKPG